MGQKVHPHGLRVGIIKDWDSKWFANKKDFSTNLIEDQKLRVFIKNKLQTSGIAKIVIERKANKVTVSIHTAKPGFIIGKGGEAIETLKKEIEALTGKEVSLNIIEVKAIDTNAQLVA